MVKQSRPTKLYDLFWHIKNTCVQDTCHYTGVSEGHIQQLNSCYLIHCMGMEEKRFYILYTTYCLAVLYSVQFSG